MKKILLLLLLAPVSSYALFEARLTYGPYLTKGDPTADICSGNALCSGSLPSKLPFPFLGVDALVKLPLVPFGFGLRYEKLTASGSSSNMEASATMNRMALLVNYRLIDTILHVGPIFSYGLSHSGSIEMKQNGSKILDYSASSGESFSLGVEVGVKPLIIIPLKVGAEAGITQFKFKDAKDSLGSAPKDIDLSGNYIKVFLGLDL